VSWLGLGGNESITVVEYMGKFPGLSKHVNAKTSDSYTRTDDNVMTEIGDMVKTMRLMEVYKQMNMKYDELTAPSNIRQIRDKKRRDKLGEEKRDGQVLHKET